MARIAVIDDKDILRDSLAATLAREDHDVTPFADPVEALGALKRNQFDLAMVDLKMPKMDGISLIRDVRGAGSDVPIIMMTAYATVSTAVEALKLGAVDYIQKPFDASAVAVLVDRALENARLRRENEALRASVNDYHNCRELLGDGREMSRLKEKLERVAASHATVLVTGESGTGKELVAAYVHQRSPRSEFPMLCLNCAALSPNLLESELFGHERGAFTGAERTRKGRFELADGGTLLLDEISEMAVPLQAKLLRVLQEGEFERVGSSVTRRADVRVIATTNRDLRDWVARGRFREDLYYRLNVLPLAIPPLRDRMDDIPVLVEHFLRKSAVGDQTSKLRVAPTAGGDAVQRRSDYGGPDRAVADRWGVVARDGWHRSAARRADVAGHGAAPDREDAGQVRRASGEISEGAGHGCSNIEYEVEAVAGRGRVAAADVDGCDGGLNGRATVRRHRTGGNAQLLPMRNSCRWSA